jgi:hypothetical protein
MDRTELKTLGERIADGMREVGVLLLAFAPLESALSHRGEGSRDFLMLFFGSGMSLFSVALVLEWRWLKGPTWSLLLLLLFLILGAILVGTALVRGTSP